MGTSVVALLPPPTHPWPFSWLTLVTLRAFQVAQSLCLHLVTEYHTLCALHPGAHTYTLLPHSAPYAEGTSKSQAIRIRGRVRPLVSESASTHLMPSDRCFLFWGTSGFSPQSENQPFPHIPLYSQCSAHAQFILGDGNGSTVYLLHRVDSCSFFPLFLVVQSFSELFSL